MINYWQRNGSNVKKWKGAASNSSGTEFARVVTRMKKHKDLRSITINVEFCRFIKENLRAMLNGYIQQYNHTGKVSSLRTPIIQSPSSNNESSSIIQSPLISNKNKNNKQNPNKKPQSNIKKLPHDKTQWTKQDLLNYYIHNILDIPQFNHMISEKTHDIAITRPLNDMEKQDLWGIPSLPLIGKTTGNNANSLVYLYCINKINKINT